MSATIIAELGLSHRGHPTTALQSIETFARLGADVIKFQDHRGQQIPPDQEHPSPRVNMPRAQYYAERTWADDRAWQELREACHRVGVRYAVSPFSSEAVERQLARSPPDIWKIASGQVADHDTWSRIPRDAQVLVSWGLGRSNAIPELLDKRWLQCTSAYPMAAEMADAWSWNFSETNCVGLSDHEPRDTDAAAILAVAKGALYIERHAALNPLEDDADYDVALTPDEFERFMRNVGYAERALGHPRHRLGGRDAYLQSDEGRRMRAVYMGEDGQ